MRMHALISIHARGDDTECCRHTYILQIARHTLHPYLILTLSGTPLLLSFKSHRSPHESVRQDDSVCRCHQGLP